MKECCEIERQKSVVRFIESDFRREIRYETESAKEVYVLVVAGHFCVRYDRGVSSCAVHSRELRGHRGFCGLRLAVCR